MPGADGAGNEPSTTTPWRRAPVSRAAVAPSRGDIPRSGGRPVSLSGGGALPPARSSRHARLRAYGYEHGHGGPDLSETGRAAAGDRAGGDARQAVLFAGTACEAGWAAANAHGRSARLARTTADAARRDLVELRSPQSG